MYNKYWLNLNSPEKKMKKNKKPGLYGSLSIHIRLLEVLMDSKSEETAKRQEDTIIEMKNKEVSKIHVKRTLNSMVQQRLVHRTLHKIDSMPAYYLSDEAQNALKTLIRMKNK